jgi:hypothetical protein
MDGRSCLVGLLVLRILTSAPAPMLRSNSPVTIRQRPTGQLSSSEVPRNSTPQNLPCANQPRTLTELTASFDKGRQPLATEVNGSWVAIGFVGGSIDIPSLNCTGVKRGDKFEFVIVANRYSLELDAIGMTYSQTVIMEPDHKGSAQFPVDFAGDNVPIYRCRLTPRKTLACLVDMYHQGVEFKRMLVREDQIERVKPMR